LASTSKAITWQHSWSMERRTSAAPSRAGGRMNRHRLSKREGRRLRKIRWKGSEVIGLMILFAVLAWLSVYAPMLLNSHKN
jgi:hypothetical protein